MNLTFSPAEADMDFGLIAPDKKFYSFKGADGTFKENIQVSMTGKQDGRENAKFSYELFGNKETMYGFVCFWKCDIPCSNRQIFILGIYDIQDSTSLQG